MHTLIDLSPMSVSVYCSGLTDFAVAGLCGGPTVCGGSYGNIGYPFYMASSFDPTLYTVTFLIHINLNTRPII